MTPYKAATVALSATATLFAALAYLAIGPSYDDWQRVATMNLPWGC